MIFTADKFLNRELVSLDPFDDQKVADIAAHSAHLKAMGFTSVRVGTVTKRIQ